MRLCISGLLFVFFTLSVGGVNAQQGYIFEDTLKPNLQADDQPEIAADEDSVYEEVEAAIDSLDYYLNNDYVPKVSMELLKDRLQCIENEIPLHLNKKVAGFIDFFMVRKRNYTQTMLERKEYYFPIFEHYLAKYSLPDELKYLAVVESGLNYAALSRAGALGLWQFMNFTGKDYGLKQDFFIDERMDPHKGTEAACRLLKRLHNMFNDWELALAAYNCGPGNVISAMRRSGYRHFWDIYDYLPRETRSYVPQFVALTYALNYAEHHNLYPDADSTLKAIELDSVEIYGKCISLDLLAKQMGVPEWQLRVNNPTLRRLVTPNDRAYHIKMPKGYASFYRMNEESLMDSVVVGYKQLLARGKNRRERGVELSSDKTIATYRVHKGDGLFKIARKYGVTVADIRAWNNISEGEGLTSGQKLVIRRNSGKTESNLATKTSRKKQAEGKFYTVQPGDTLWAISQKHDGITVSDLIRLNRLKGKKIEVGQRLIVG